MRPLVGEGRIVERGGTVTAPAVASWGDGAVTFDHRSWTCDDAEISWTAPQHLIVFTEAGGTATTEVRVDGRRAYDGRDAPGALTFIPACAHRSGAYRRADLSYAALWIDPAIGDGLPGCGSLSTPAAFVNGEDGVVTALMRGLRDEASAGRAPGAAYVEHMTALVLMRLAAIDGVAPRPDVAGALAGPALARVTDYVEANLASDISLAALAHVAALPVDRFARRFKAATGLAPYAYVLERRVRAAERLLARLDASIVDVALALGFSSQSHFTAVFRQRTGRTPKAYRRQIVPET
jgi:AraC family transcriptional regulator